MVTMITFSGHCTVGKVNFLFFQTAPRNSGRSEKFWMVGNPNYVAPPHWKKTSREYVLNP